MGITRRLAAGMLTSVIFLGLQQSAVAGGGDFIGGVIAGGILGTIINQGLAQGHSPQRRAAPPRRVVMDPAEVQYWRSVQQALNSVGINVGAADGVPGRQTRLGVKRFQARIGSEPSGQLTQSDYQTLMQQAGLGDSGASAAAAPATSDDYVPEAETTDDGVVALAPVAKLPAPSEPSTDIRAPAPADPAPAMVDEGAASPVLSLAPKAPLADPGPSKEEAPVEPAAPIEKFDTPPAAVAGTAPVKPKVDTSVLDDLMASPTKPLQDADIDAFGKKIAVLGLHLGDKAGAASESLKAAFENCTSKGNLTECSATKTSYSDKVRVASLGEGEASTLYYVSRTVTLTTPLAKSAIVAKLNETLKDVVERPFMLIAAPPACQGALSAQGSGAQEAIEADAISGVATDALGSLKDACRAFFRVEIPEKDGLATGFAITLFDGRQLAKPAGDVAGAAGKSNPPAAVPSELKL